MPQYFVIKKTQGAQHFSEIFRNNTSYDNLISAEMNFRQGKDYAIMRVLIDIRYPIQDEEE